MGPADATSAEGSGPGSGARGAAAWPLTWPDGWFVTVVDETGSTNADLVAEGVRGASDRTVLVARHQTAGRGRLDRTWDAPPGANLLVSVLFRELPAHLHQLTQRIALAAREACAGLAGVRADLKWPNDLVVDDRKLAGILAQAGTVEGELAFVVVGLGLNVGWAPPGAVCLADLAGERAAGLTPGHVLHGVLEALDAPPDDVAAAYREALATLGRQVRVTLPGDAEPLDGRAVAVEDDGRLVVLDACGITHRIGTAEVVHLRPA